MDESKSVPDVKLTSCHFYENSDEGLKKKGSSEAPFACGAVIHPFHHYEPEFENITYRAPIICTTCGGFLSIHAVINPATGEWCCPLCRSTNTRFHSGGNLPADKNYDQYLREIYPELQSKHCDFHEIQFDSNIAVASYTDVYSQVLNPLYVFAIDCSVLSDGGTINMLLNGLKKLARVSPTSKVCCLVFDHNIRVVRLSTVTVDPVLSMDILPGHRDADSGSSASGGNAESDMLLHFFQRGMYSTTAEMLLEHFELLRQVLLNLTPPYSHSSSSSQPQQQQRKSTINSVVETSLAVLGFPLSGMKNGRVDHTPKNNHNIRLVILTGGLLPIVADYMTSINTANFTGSILSAALPSTTNLTTAAGRKNRLLTAYQNVGKFAYLNNMSIDVYYSNFTMGDYTPNIDKYEALVSPGGGNVVRCEDYSEENVVESFENLLGNSIKSHHAVCCSGAGASSGILNDTQSGVVTTTDNRYINSKNSNSTKTNTSYRIDTRAAKMATMEVRTCGQLSVDQIVGPVVPVEDTIYYRNASTGSGTGGIRNIQELTVDKQHVVTTLSMIDTAAVTARNNISTNTGGNTDTSPMFEKGDNIYSKLLQFNTTNSTVITGLPSSSHTYPDSTMLSVIFNHYDAASNADSDGTQNKIANISTTQAVQNLFRNNKGGGGGSRKFIQINIPLPFANNSGGSESLPLYDTSASQGAAAGGGSSRTDSMTPNNDKYDTYGTTPKEKENYLNGVFIQFVIRYEQFNLTTPPGTGATTVVGIHGTGNAVFGTTNNQQSSSPQKYNFHANRHSANPHTHMTSVAKVTRVYTLRLDKTEDYSEYLAGLDAPLYGLVSSRGVVADYHNDSLETFGGVRKTKLDEQGRYMYGNVRQKSLDTVDREVQNIASAGMNSSTGSYKALTICRMLHHLREGPLLDGPSMQPVDAYLLRSQFLKAPFYHAMRLIMPSLKLASLQAPTKKKLKENESAAVAAAVGLDSTLAAFPPPVNPPSGSSVSFPPPNTPPPVVMATDISLQQQQYLPPPTTPHPLSTVQLAPGTIAGILLPPPSTPHPSTMSTGSTAATGDTKDTLTIHSVAPDSMSLLPYTVALIDYGDRIIVKVNGPAKAGTDRGDEQRAQQEAEDSDTDSESDSHRDKVKKTQATGETKPHNDKLEQVIQQLTTIAHSIAATRYPVPSVHVITVPYSPVNRLVYSRLSPNHMDGKHNLLLLYASEHTVSETNAFATAHATASAKHSAKLHANSNTPVSPAIAVKPILPDHTLTEAEIDHMISLAPITDQLFLSKYMYSVIKSHTTVNALLNSSETADSETVFIKNVTDGTGGEGGQGSRFAPPPAGQSMDRDGGGEEEEDGDKMDGESDSSGFALRDAKSGHATAVADSNSEKENTTTVWNDITSLFSSIVPIGGGKAKSSSANDYSGSSGKLDDVLSTV